MNVWISRVRRVAKCYYCDKPIETGSYQVVCSFTFKHNDKLWRRQLHFHAKEPYCWVERAITELEQKTKIETRGRKLLSLPDEQKVQRKKLLTTHASLRQRLSIAIHKGKIASIERIIMRVEEVRNKIAVCGGIPSSWGEC